MGTTDNVVRNVIHINEEGSSFIGVGPNYRDHKKMATKGILTPNSCIKHGAFLFLMF